MKNRFSMSPGVVLRSKIRSGAFAAGILLVLAIVPPDALGQGIFYRLTSIADTQESFPFASLSQFPCQNNSSRVAFEAGLVGGVQGMFSRHGLGGIDTLADNGLGEYDSFGLDCSINGNGMVLFSALKRVQDGFVSVLLRGGGGNLLLPLLSSDGPYDQFSGWQLNLQGKTVMLASRADGSGDVILIKGAGPLTGPEKIIADTRPSSPYAGFGFAPSINALNSVAFTGVRRDGSIAIIMVADDGTVTPLIDTGGPFAGFSDIDLSGSGSLAFDGSQYGGVRGVWRIDTGSSSPVLTKITDSTGTGSTNFTAVSINDSGQVAYSFRDPSNSVSTVGIGNGNRIHTVFGPGPVVLGPGAIVFGRTVGSVEIGRDSLNSLGQIVLHIDFADGSNMIARADPVNPFTDLVSTEGALALTTGAGDGTGAGTTVSLPATLLLLTFDVTFLTNQGELKVQLGDRLLTNVRASSRGVRQRIQVPIDLRQKTRSTTPRKAQELKFQVAGAPGAVVQIGNINLPGGGLSSRQFDTSTRWHFDTQGGGWGGVVDATRFPVQIKVLGQEPRQVAAQAGSPSVAILSSASFDAIRDIQRDTLNFAGLSVRRQRDEKGGEHAQCSERDVDGDKRPDLVCDFGSPAPPAGGPKRVRKATLEGMTPYGWMIEGRAD